MVVEKRDDLLGEAVADAGDFGDGVGGSLAQTGHAAELPQQGGLPVSGQGPELWSCCRVQNCTGSIRFNARYRSRKFQTVLS